MPPRYRAALALTLALAASLPAAARAPRRHHRDVPATAAAMPADALYSARALRRVRTILQLKLWELRRERLERIRKALEKNVPVEQLLKMP
jgi:hypothetical protein